jgi:3-oxoacyl-[acyl-carrier protein] reductase
MDLNLSGKKALVTGSSSGIGEGIAKTLAREGAIVTVHGRNSDRARRVADEINKTGGKAFVAAGDLIKDAEARRVAETAIKTMGGVDILVNNAGGADGEPVTWGGGTIEDWREKFEQNLFGSVRLLQALLPRMRTQGWGRIVQVATGWAMQPGTVAVDYAAAKAALVNTTVSLAKDLAGTGITANTISPGPILTPTLERTARGVAKAQDWGESWEEIEKNFVKHIVPNPTGRIGRVEDIAAAVTFLASPLAGYINGANLRVDGGYVTSIN